MKNFRRCSVLFVVCGFGLLSFPEAAQSQGFYVNANAGVALGEDVSVRQFLVPTRGDAELDPGSRFSVAGGYNFNDFIGVELETGFIYNEVDGAEIALGHVPLLANVVFLYDRPNLKLIPFAGAGAGGDVSAIDLDDVRAPNGAIVDGSESDFVFAWQAFAGARYKLTDNMSLGAAYKFHWADGASWDVERSAGGIEFGTARIHSVTVDFNFKF